MSVNEKIVFALYSRETYINLMATVKYTCCAKHQLISTLQRPRKNYLFETKLRNISQLLKIVNFSIMKLRNKIINNYRCL